MGDFQGEIKTEVRATIAADREDIARQCSEAHGRIDYQFRTQEESLERIRSEQHKLPADITAAIEDLNRRVLDREHQELEKMHTRLTEEMQLSIANAFKALEPAKDREQRKLRQHQHIVGRKLAELDQMMQLIGRQLIQNTSQLQVVRNEQLVHNFELDLQNEDAGYDDDDLREDTSEFRTRQSQHQELQEQLDKKLRDYSQVLGSSQRQAQEDEDKPTQPPKK
ncbi:hypothetical protein PHYSODRAFT_503055 [Phytophthora sojae]|uniref:Uncharacterized protein n=1 Tax=Phytophthora sojae (strain P6497) TaxID=1094619 RepID=G4ZDG8_PHYSP|nr:hypothetical protein PHYSODRAFT_503055 [Phytophthora sojae]EGZ17818.1 hypothetical protein PHYSODRAFT_503055 [Phytophthora sojae]|eukprot:XP_009526876.1 hypothetical protein PHYSODRAFT_503055 [Phytophthora sojae]